MPTIECKNVKVAYYKKKDKTTVLGLDNFSATFQNEKFSLILGSSGCGKTTLLRAIAGLEKYEGEIEYNGLDSRFIEIQRRNLSFVSQNYVLYPHMTVFDNIAYPLKSAGTPRDEIIERVSELAKRFELEPCLLRKPRDLSGGQQQRVAIARALIKKPQICLFDEPFSNLDHTTRVEERRFIKKALMGSLCTVIFVTHNMEDAYNLADTIYVMDKGQLVFMGTPNEVYHSTHPIVRALVQNNDDLL